MRYEDARRLSGVESAWMRVKFWFRPVFPQAGPVISDLSHLSDLERRDIGLSEQVRYMDGEPVRSLDWHTLKDQR